MELIKDITEWRKKTFPKSDDISTYNHLIREVKELGEALEYGPIGPIKKEIADCVILLIGLADVLNIDILQAVKEKHQINVKRQWGSPDEYGVVEHIEGAESC